MAGFPRACVGSDLNFMSGINLKLLLFLVTAISFEKLIFLRRNNLKNQPNMIPTGYLLKLLSYFLIYHLRNVGKKHILCYTLSRLFPDFPYRTLVGRKFYLTCPVMLPSFAHLTLEFIKFQYIITF